MKIEFIILAQQVLNHRVQAGLAARGNWASRSDAAAKRFVGHIKTRGIMTSVRWQTLTIQHEANLSGKVPHHVEPDGWFGPVTKDAAHRMLGEKFDRPDKPSDIPPARVRCWTPTDQQMIQRYGNPGASQVLTMLPFSMRLDWDTATSVTRSQMHRIAAKPITNALEEIRDHYGIERMRALNIDRFGGILNVRKKRGGSTWSAHAWGTAIDLWPAANQLAWKRDRAAFARDEYKPMREAFRRAGLMSLGECYDFDWMHWQLNP